MAVYDVPPENKQGLTIRQMLFICFCVCFFAVFSCVYGWRFFAVCAFFRRALKLSL